MPTPLRLGQMAYPIPGDDSGLQRLLHGSTRLSYRPIKEDQEALVLPNRGRSPSPEGYRLSLAIPAKHQGHVTGAEVRRHVAWTEATQRVDCHSEIGFSFAPAWTTPLWSS